MGIEKPNSNGKLIAVRVGSPSHQNKTLKHILDLAEENTKGLDGYGMIAEWAHKAINWSRKE